MGNQCAGITCDSTSSCPLSSANTNSCTHPVPSEKPTTTPTYAKNSPTFKPTLVPSLYPTINPSINPTARPTTLPSSYHPTAVATQAGTCLPGYKVSCIVDSSNFHALKLQELGFSQTNQMNNTFSINFLGMMFILFTLFGFFLGRRYESKKVMKNKLLEVEKNGTKNDSKSYYGSTIVA